MIRIVNLTKLKSIYRQSFVMLLLAVFVAGCIPTPAFALSAAQTKINNKAIQWLVAAEGEFCATATTGGSGGEVDSSVESENARTAYDYFVGKGLAPFRAAAIVGNFQVEAPGVNPRQSQNGGGAGRGIAQWGVTARWVQLQNYARTHGNQDIYDLTLQLDFAWHEMETSYKDALTALKQTTTMTGPGGATEVFMLRYEQPGVPHLDRRETAARSILQLYGNGAADNGPVDTSGDTGGNDPEGGAGGATDGPCPASGNFSGAPGQTKKLGKGFTLNENTDYSATPCFAGSTEARVYTHPVRHYKIRICIVNGTSIDVASIVSERVVNMVKDAKTAGVNLNGGGFRTYEEQLALRSVNGCSSPSGPSNAGCSPPTAPPGNSQHERGLAIDFSNGGSIGRGSSEFNWLSRNAAKYGYYNLPIESWHWSTSGN